jgi:DNA-binding transcriptional LysR family regulator
MDLADLRIFRSVANEGGITRAAEKLHRVQSNITTRVRQLEDDLGVELFIREGKKLHLSPSGKLLLGYADRLLDLAQEARDAVHDASPRGLLRLGAMESTASIRLPAPLSEYHRLYPEVKIELRTGNTRQLASAMLAGELDAALLAEPVADGPFEKVPIFDEELVIVAAAGHQPIKSAGDAEQRTVLAFEPGCPHRQRLEDWFARCDDLPERVIEMSSYHAILGCAVAGMGIALLPRSVLTTFPESQYLSVHALPQGLDRIQVSLAWRKGARSPNVGALADILTAKVNSENATGNGQRHGGKTNGKRKPRA